MPPRQVLARTLGNIHVGAARAMEHKRQQDSEYDLREIELQYQLTVRGEAGTLPSWTDLPLEVRFEWGFHYAPMQRDSELELPQFTYGTYLTSSIPVAIFANVVRWEIQEENGAIVGADVSVGALGHDLTAMIPFNGFIHANFQGLAQSLDVTSENPDLEIGS